jgi:hypothetical protein
MRLLVAPLDELMMRRLKKRRLALRDEMRGCRCARPGRAGLTHASAPDQVEEAFAPDGVLSRAMLRSFPPRSGQTEMALAIGAHHRQRRVLVVEAGTGVGKTFSYLVPALLSGARVLLSTATKTLQDQLFSRDLPNWCRRWACRCVSPCSRAGAVTCACTAWSWRARPGTA